MQEGSRVLGKKDRGKGERADKEEIEMRMEIRK